MEMMRRLERSDERADYTDMFRFIESLKFRPETYRTILREKFDNRNTETNKVRKKIGRLVNQGLIAAGLLDGESAIKIFYNLEKQYFILILKNKAGLYNYYFCSGVAKGKVKGAVILFNAYILKGMDWEYISNVSVKKKDVSRWF